MLWCRRWSPRWATPTLSSSTADLTHGQETLSSRRPASAIRWNAGFARRGDARIEARRDASSETAFKLYDTYGFPFDLTEDALKARGIGVDAKGFAAVYMERQRARARKSWAGWGEAAYRDLVVELKEEVGAARVSGLRR